MRWEGKLHFCGDTINTDSWFIKRSGNPANMPQLNFSLCCDKELKAAQKLDGKYVEIILRETSNPSKKEMKK